LTFQRGGRGEKAYSCHSQKLCRVFSRCMDRISPIVFLKIPSSFSFPWTRKSAFEVKVYFQPWCEDVIAKGRGLAFLSSSLTSLLPPVSWDFLYLHWLSD